ncbi:MAG: hypothetical protein ABI877_09095 [Gemmatimonadaceae bacterium]
MTDRTAAVYEADNGAQHIGRRREEAAMHAQLIGAKGDDGGSVGGQRTVAYPCETEGVQPRQEVVGVRRPPGRRFGGGGRADVARRQGPFIGRQGQLQLRPPQEATPQGA